MEVILLAGLTFLGYVIGRIGDWYGGHLDAPHHWIHGLLMFAMGLLFYTTVLGDVSSSFGVGLFVSDFKDFMDMKFWGPDDKKEKKFWAFD